MGQEKTSGRFKATLYKRALIAVALDFGARKSDLGTAYTSFAEVRVALARTRRSLDDGKLLRSLQELAELGFVEVHEKEKLYRATAAGEQWMFEYGGCGTVLYNYAQSLERRCRRLKRERQTTFDELKRRYLAAAEDDPWEEGPQMAAKQPRVVFISPPVFAAVPSSAVVYTGKCAPAGVTAAGETVMEISGNAEIVYSGQVVRFIAQEVLRVY